MPLLLLAPLGLALPSTGWASCARLHKRMLDFYGLLDLPFLGRPRGRAWSVHLVPISTVKDLGAVQSSYF